jgi:hypothetical protein
MLVSFLCCTKKKIPDESSLLGLAYYPVTPGKYVIYDVDSLVYGQLPRDTVLYKYRIKEKLADTFSDSQGRQAIRLERCIKRYDPARSYDSLPWTIKEVWMVNADNKSVQVVESNTRYTKLIFPIQEKAGWNGNAYNTIGEWEYFYDYVDRSESFNQIRVDQVLKVIQKEYRTLISYQSYTEKYGKDIGLVYREIKDLLSNRITAGVPVEDRIESGVIYKQTLVNYGYE